MPNNSYLHLDDFPSVEKLSERINYLIDPKNVVEYFKYFKWRMSVENLRKAQAQQNLRFTTLKEYASKSMCEICRLANQVKSGEVKPGDYPPIDSIEKYWFGFEREGKKLDYFRYKLGKDIQVCRENKYSKGNILEIYEELHGKLSELL